ncbi:MAG: AraC family transcriptional regulator [Sphaerochaetaceae bacterium]|jgi:AraC family L-rhamnose operon transcriptional activator RhaR/AraC family L-rhamnose operon regulatory protein RhaS|nr:AraC family transcriptional regulator [Sphaerochaetaceae bacterium]
MNLKLLSSDYFYDPSFKMKVIERDPELPYPLHSHDFFELVVIVSGKGTHYTVANSFSLLPGNVFVITPGLEHGYRDVENLRLYNILFDIKLFDEAFFDLRNMPGYHALLRIEPNYRNDVGISTLMQLTPAQMAEIVPLLEHMQLEADAIETDIGAQTQAFAYLLHLLVILFRIYAEHPRKDNQTIMRIADALSFLESHTDRPVGTKELMELTNMSASTLNRHFRNATALSPVEFHIQRRIERACRLIRTSGLSMGEISEATGFSDANYFSRQFRKVMGMSPIQYRNNRAIWYR